MMRLMYHAFWVIAIAMSLTALIYCVIGLALSMAASCQ